MEKQSNVKLWMNQIRAPFLILAVFLVLIGLALVLRYQENLNQSFNWFDALLILLGVVSAHISVNLFNEYSDFKSGIDFDTQKTPFSGGSGMLTQELIKPAKVRIAAIFTLLFSLVIGIYFTITSHWTIIPIALIGAFSIMFYTNFFARIMLGELFAGLSLGSLVVIGTYIAMHATPGMPLNALVPKEVYLLSIPPGILTSLLLFINEFPDMEADKKGGRKHLVIALGLRKAGYVYAFGMFLTFGTIVILPLTGITTSWVYLALLPLPLAIKASATAIKHGHDIPKMIPALGSNVITVLATDLLLAVAIFIDVI